MLFGKKRPARLRIVEAMVLRRASLHESPSPGEAQELEAAKRRCLGCHFTALCDEALQKSDAAGFSRFCPNCAYLQHVLRESLRF